MKKLLILILSVCMCFTVFFAAGCAEYTPPSGGNTGDNTNNGENNNNKPNKDDPYTAKLYLNGEPYAPRDGMTATWTDLYGESVHTAEFDENGVATVEGLDGDYKVTVSGLPDGYTYNPNIYIADGDENRDMNIQLFEVKTGYGLGTGWYANTVMTFTDEGYYRLTFTEAGQEIKCRFSTTERGNYGIQSLIDTSANEYNPSLAVHYGSNGYVNETPTVTVNDGGASSVYTKNFLYSFGTDGNGIQPFAVRCASRLRDGFPVSVDILIWQIDGQYDSQVMSFQTVFPKENFKQTPDYDGYTLVDFGTYKHNDAVCECRSTCPCKRGFACTDTLCGGCQNSVLLDGSDVGYSDPLNGGDGYYHLRDENGGLSDTILYVKLNTANRLVNFFNPELSLKFGGKNYHYLIRGYSIETVITDDMGNQTKVDMGYLGSIGGEEKIPEEDKPYLAALTRETADGEKPVSYIDYVNNDGVYAVTEELRQFLQAFSIKSAYFMDGLGYAEGEGMQATNNDQWLFACCYYVKF